MTDPDPLRHWIAYMRAEDLTDRTIKERRRFYLYIEDHVGCMLTLNRLQLVEYLGTPGWSNTTRQHYRSALHTIFTWLQDEEYRADNPAARLPHVRARHRTPTPLTAEEIRRIVNGGNYKKTRVMIALHYYLGMRVHEIAKMHGHDIDWEARTVTIFGKGAKTVHLPINGQLWLIAQTMPHDGYWFPNWKDNRLYPAGEGHIISNSVSTIISQAIHRAGIEGHRPHDLRASTATLQSRAGVDPFIVQKNMRHESMTTTAGYRLVDPEEMRAGFEMLPTVQMPATSNRRHAA